MNDVSYACTLTVNGWQLYSYEWDEGPEATKARARVKRRARSLSKRLTKLVRKAHERLAENPQLSERKLAEEVRDKMYALMGRYSSDGAMDTEPQCVLVAELEEAFDLPRYEMER